MTITHYDEHDNTTEFPEASKWQATIAVRNNRCGLGFYLWNAEGKPIAAAFMNARQALEQGLYLLENAQRMLALDEEVREIQQAAIDKAFADLTAWQEAEWEKGLPKVVEALVEPAIKAAGLNEADEQAYRERVRESVRQSLAAKKLKQ